MTSFLRGLARDRVVMTVIMVNAVTLFQYAFPDAQATERTALDYACTVYFVVEIATKVSFQGWSPYWEAPGIGSTLPIRETVRTPLPRRAVDRV
jgi:hypothetical protein